MNTLRIFDDLNEVEKVTAILAVSRRPLSAKDVLRMAGVSTTTAEIDQLLTGSRLPEQEWRYPDIPMHKLDVDPKFWSVVLIDVRSVHAQMVGALAVEL